MFLKIAGFEFRYQLKNPVFWVASFVVALLCFGSVASSNVQIGSGGNIHKNAPVAIAQATVIFVTIYMFVTTAFVGWKPMSMVMALPRPRSETNAPVTVTQQSAI